MFFPEYKNFFKPFLDYFHRDVLDRSIVLTGDNNVFLPLWVNVYEAVGIMAAFVACLNDWLRWPFRPDLSLRPITGPPSGIYYCWSFYGRAAIVLRVTRISRGALYYVSGRIPLRKEQVIGEYGLL